MEKEHESRKERRGHKQRRSSKDLASAAYQAGVQRFSGILPFRYDGRNLKRYGTIFNTLAAACPVAAKSWPSRRPPRAPS
jgi:hypothetical protein